MSTDARVQVCAKKYGPVAKFSPSRNCAAAVLIANVSGTNPPRAYQERRCHGTATSAATSASRPNCDHFRPDGRRSRTRTSTPAGMARSGRVRTARPQSTPVATVRPSTA